MLFSYESTLNHINLILNGKLKNSISCQYLLYFTSCVAFVLNATGNKCVEEGHLMTFSWIFRFSREEVSN